MCTYTSMQLRELRLRLKRPQRTSPSAAPIGGGDNTDRYILIYIDIVCRYTYTYTYMQSKRIASALEEAAKDMRLQLHPSAEVTTPIDTILIYIYIYIYIWREREYMGFTRE